MTIHGDTQTKARLQKAHGQSSVPVCQAHPGLRPFPSEVTCGTQLVQEKEEGKGDSRWPQRNLLPGFAGCGLGEEAGKGYTR